MSILFPLSDKFLKMKKAEKRKLYKCGDNYTILDDVENWPQHFKRKLAGDEFMQKWWKRTVFIFIFCSHS